MKIQHVAPGYFLCVADNRQPEDVAILRIRNGRERIEFTRPQLSIPLDVRLKAVRALLRVSGKAAV